MLSSENIQIKYEAQKAFTNLLKYLKDAAFNEKWDSIFGFAWSSVKSSKSYIEKIGNDDSFEISK